jgi:methionyl aminopeptidase
MITIKTERELEIMAEGGKKLARVKNSLRDAVKEGVSAMEIEELAMKLIKEENSEPAFARVPGYQWATCISVNEGLVHGIPKREMIFKKGDIVSVDVGIFYRGFNTDTSITVGIDLGEEDKKFLNVGKMALEKAISKVKPGNYIYDISEAIEEIIEGHGYSTIKALVGHGVGKELHEDPQIPCFVPAGREESPKIEVGMALAVEVMYAKGSDKVQVDEDGWTISMRDDKMSALFEETVAVTPKGPKVLTV